MTPAAGPSLAGSGVCLSPTQQAFARQSRQAGFAACVCSDTNAQRSSELKLTLAFVLLVPLPLLAWSRCARRCRPSLWRRSAASCGALRRTLQPKRRRTRQWRCTSRVSSEAANMRGGIQARVARPCTAHVIACCATTSRVPVIYNPYTNKCVVAR